jgi:uncharacterized protein YceK
MKKLSLIVVGLLLTGCSTVYKPTMREAAIADTLSTAMILEHSDQFHEMNPLGFPLTIVGKAALIYYAENCLSPESRKILENYASSLWTGATVNNILLFLTSSPHFSLLVGAITSIYLINQ